MRFIDLSAWILEVDSCCTVLTCEIFRFPRLKQFLLDCALFFILDLFKLKFEEKWFPMYELAKSSLNNRGNEIRSSERKSNENKENMPNGNGGLVAEEMNEAA